MGFDAADVPDGDKPLTAEEELRSILELAETANPERALETFLTGMAEHIASFTQPAAMLSGIGRLGGLLITPEFGAALSGVRSQPVSAALMVEVSFTAHAAVTASLEVNRRAHVFPVWVYQARVLALAIVLVVFVLDPNIKLSDEILGKLAVVLGVPPFIDVMAKWMKPPE